MLLVYSGCSDSLIVFDSPSISSVISSPIRTNFLPPLCFKGIIFLSFSSFSSSSIKVGKGAGPAMANADSKSSGRTDVCLRFHGVDGVLRGATPVIRPSSRAESSVSDAPENLLERLTGVETSEEPTSPEDSLLLRLVGETGISSFFDVKTFFRGVRCLGRADPLNGVSCSSIISEEAVLFFADCLVLIGLSDIAEAKLMDFFDPHASFSVTQEMKWDLFQECYYYSCFS